ncbi:MAG: hypothetical protein ACREP0_04785 [Rhodanobacteraceae bacterium]
MHGVHPVDSRLGVWAARIPWMVVPTIILIAVVATFLCNALQTGPPGAYTFALACAAGTGITAGDLSVAQIGLLVFTGGSFAWLVHMAGALVQPRAPERAAVVSARTRTRPAPLSRLPKVLDAEMRNLHDSLVHVGTGGSIQALRSG